MIPKLALLALDHAPLILTACLCCCIPWAVIRVGDWVACRWVRVTDGEGS